MARNLTFWIYSCCWRTLLWNLLMLVRNLTLRPLHYGDKPYIEALKVVTLTLNLTLGLTHASEKLYSKTYLLWWKNLHLRLAHEDDEPYTETSCCWWQTLLNICMKECDEEILSNWQCFELSYFPNFVSNALRPIVHSLYNQLVQYFFQEISKASHTSYIPKEHSHKAVWY